MTDRLMARLLELALAARQSGAIMAGGLGLLCKRRHLVRTGQRTIAGNPALLPEARATLDVDLFLRLEMFVTPGKAAVFRQAIEALGYAVRTPNFQYSVEDEPVAIDLEADGGVQTVDVAHPYAWANMKVRAAWDWRQAARVPAGGRQTSSKHCFDAALIGAMLTEQESGQCADLARRYAGLAIAQDIKAEAVALFARTDSPGWLQAIRDGMTVAHAVAWEGLRLTLGIDNDSTLPASV